MSDRPSFSTLRTSVSLARESQVEQLAKKLQKAVGRTVENIPKNDRYSRRFLPKTDLDQILTYKSLDLLFRELVCVGSSSGVEDVSQAIASDAADEQNGAYPTCADEVIENCVSATTGTPSRKSLLALFLYEDRLELLLLFLAWLTSESERPAADRNRFIPSDDSMPFTEERLFCYRIPDRYHGSILEEQAIFKPKTIQKLKHHVINSSERLPFVGRQEPIKSGSQGQVVKAVISQSHWEIQEDEAQNVSNFVPGNPNSAKIVALKIFKAVQPVRDMDEATEYFKIELEILEKLREYKTKHEMIMLHLGSITELDEVGSPIRHSLIFELASFSLEDLLKDRNRAQKDILPSRLLASLVDIVEALECLHNKLETYHLDIKPDNILIFETYSGSKSQDQYELTWKLSDFGLAGKKIAKKRRTGSTQTSTATSRGSTLPATRPTGLYQAPEIQELETSLAGQGSDVWSIGCVILMVLAFIDNGSTAVMGLETFLMVDFLKCAGKEPLFYIRSDSYPWEDRAAYLCCYLPGQDLDVDEIPNTGGLLSAALHPLLIHWSNTLLRATYDQQIEQRFVLDILRVIFGRVLRINRNKRIGATELRSRLASIQRSWKAYDLGHADYGYRDISKELRPLQNRRSRKHGTSHQGRSDGLLADQVPEARSSISETANLPAAVADPRNTRQDTLHNPRQEEWIQVQDPTAQTQDPTVPIPNELVQVHTGTTASTVQEAMQGQQALIQEQTPRMQEQLRSAIERDDAASVRLLLGENPEMLDQPCPGVSRYPIEWALFRNAYNAFDELLKNASPEIAKKEYSGRTALDLALDSGKPAAALDCIRKHRDKFDFPLPLYEKRRKKLGRDAKEIADDLFDIGARRAATPRPNSFFPWRRSQTSSSSA